MSENSADSSNPSYFEYPSEESVGMDSHDSELSHLFSEGDEDSTSELPGVVRRFEGPADVEAGEEVNQPEQQAMEIEIIVISDDEEEVPLLLPLDRHVQRWRMEEVGEIVDDYWEQRHDADLMAAEHIPHPQFPPAVRHRRCFSF